MISDSFRWGAYRQLSARERDVFDYMAENSSDGMYEKGQLYTAYKLEVSLGTVKAAFLKLLDMNAVVIMGRTTRRGMERVAINPRFYSDCILSDQQKARAIQTYDDFVALEADKKAQGL